MHLTLFFELIVELNQLQDEPKELNLETEKNQSQGKHHVKSFRKNPIKLS